MGREALEATLTDETEMNFPSGSLFGILFFLVMAQIKALNVPIYSMNEMWKSSHYTVKYKIIAWLIKAFE